MKPFTFFDDDEPELEPSESDRHRRAFSDLTRGQTLKIGSKVFNIFNDQGVVKYATIVGTAGRKFYKIFPVSEAGAPFEVGVYEVLQQVPERIAEKPIAKGMLR